MCCVRGRSSTRNRARPFGTSHGAEWILAMGTAHQFVLDSRRAGCQRSRRAQSSHRGSPPDSIAEPRPDQLWLSGSCWMALRAKAGRARIVCVCVCRCQREDRAQPRPGPSVRSTLRAAAEAWTGFARCYVAVADGGEADRFPSAGASASRSRPRRECATSGTRCPDWNAST